MMFLNEISNMQSRTSGKCPRLPPYASRFRFRKLRAMGPWTTMKSTRGRVMNDRIHAPGVNAGNRPDDRLESWKRIAAYLERDVRTLRRWEKNFGLPIHRQMHDRQATVYAYRSELDAWRAARTEQDGKRAPVAPSGRSTFAVVGLLITVLIIAGALFWLRGGPAQLPFEERDWVLITRFDNRTGEEIFDDTLEYALERELSNSRFVNVAPPERVGDTLKLMKLPADARVDLQTGREVALRDGGIRALAAGRIESVGANYLLSASLVDPQTGTAVASFRRATQGKRDVLAKIEDLSRGVRQALGESMASIQQSDERLASVSTPSLEALKYYSEANRMMEGLKEREQAKIWLERAIEADPDFASAHVMLWYVKKHYRDPQALHHLERAVQLAKTASDRERYFILASYYGHLGDHPRAARMAELLVRLYPDDFWGNAQLRGYYSASHDWTRHWRQHMRLGDLRPNNPIWQRSAVIAATILGETGAAKVYARRTRDLVAQNDQLQWMDAGLQMLPVFRRWLDADLEGALHELKRLEAVAQRPSRLNDEIRSMYLTLGRLKEFHAASPPALNPDWLLALAHLDDDQFVLNAYLDTASNSYHVGFLYARAGRTAEAEAAIADPLSKRRFLGPHLISPWRALVEGEIALTRGNPGEASQLLEPVTGLAITPTPYYFLGLRSLARARQAVGETGKAITALEHGLDSRIPSIFYGPGTYFYMQNQLELMRLYRQVGRNAAAGEIETELRELLAIADEGHPMLRELEAGSRLLASE